CTIRTLDGVNVGNGIIFSPSSGTANLTVTNTMITDNANDGIVVQPTGSASATGFLSRVGLHSKGFLGLLVEGSSTTGTIHVTVTDSAATNNGTGSPPGNGSLMAEPSNTTLAVIRSLVANSSNGVITGGAGVRISQSAVMGNDVALLNAAG